ncbi:TPA: hypothetical protein ACYVCL_002197 [Klebsiella pneumoniae]|uniref:hypothetical protein n=1 Tax=Klebsiella pneumoniae TaxID=573 RepID=UPI0039EDF671
MTKSTITDKRVTSVIERLEHYACNLKWTNVRGAQDLLAAADGLRELQERRKADSEPVAWTDEQELRDVDRGGCGYLFTVNPVTPHADERRIILLYRHAQQPVVPENCPAEIRDLIASHSDALFNDDDAQEIWNACRAAMLAAAPQEVKSES